MAILNSNLKVSLVGQESVTKCLQNKKINDFEDGLEYYSALEAGCECIITEDIKDFYFSEVEVLKAEDFIKKYFSYLI